MQCKKNIRWERYATLSLKDEAGADLVCGAGGGGLVKALGIESEAEGGLDAGAEGLGVACVR